MRSRHCQFCYGAKPLQSMAQYKNMVNKLGIMIIELQYCENGSKSSKCLLNWYVILNSGNVTLNRNKTTLSYVFGRGSSIDIYNSAVFFKKHFNLNNNLNLYTSCCKFNATVVLQLK